MAKPEAAIHTAAHVPQCFPESGENLELTRFGTDFRGL
jgi:hypothetical protein